VLTYIELVETKESTMGLLNLDQVRLSLESKLQRKKTQKEKEEKEREFYIVADLLTELFDSGLLYKLDEAPIIIAENTNHALLCIYEKCIEITNTPDPEDYSIFECGEYFSKEGFYRVAEMFELTPESIQELLDLLGTEFK